MGTTVCGTGRSGGDLVARLLVVLEVAAVDAAVDDADIVHPSLDGHRVLAIRDVVEEGLPLGSTGRREAMLVAEPALHSADVSDHTRHWAPPWCLPRQLINHS